MDYETNITPIHGCYRQRLSPNEPYMFLSVIPVTTIACALKLYSTNKLILPNMTVKYFLSAVCKEVVCVIDEPDHVGKSQLWELVSFLLKT